MKLIVAGSRSITDTNAVFEILDREIATRLQLSTTNHSVRILHGGARGVDRIAGQYAATRNYPVTEFPADWEKYGRSAGPIRNREMVNQADALLAIWDGASPGTRNMIKTMNLLEKPVWVVEWVA